jgi:phosphatidylglycerophosphatase A
VPSPDQPAPAAYPFGSRPDPGWAPPAFDQQPLTPAWAAGTTQDPDRRPAGVVVAAALTWLFAGITALLFLMVVAMLMFGQDALVEALRSDARFDELNVSVDDLLAAVWVVSAVAIFWSVCAVILAVLAFRRVGWARIGLVVSAAMTMLFSLGALPASLLLVLPAAATVVLLFTGSANAWYSRRPRSFGPPPGGHPGYPGYPGQPTQQQQAQHAPPQVQQQPQAPQPPAQPPQRPSGKPPVW